MSILPMNTHFNTSPIANILSLNDIASIVGMYITMDTCEERELVVHYKDIVIRFIECTEGLSYYDTMNINNFNHDITNHSYLQSVKSNKLYFTNNEIKRTKKARNFQQDLG